VDGAHGRAAGRAVPGLTFERIAALAASGEPFALATVTWRRGPSSGKGGSKAAVYPDGRVEGWLGGACAEPTVVRVALEALQDGGSRLLVLGEDDGRHGVTAVPMACSSEGAMEVFVEAVLPAPDLWVVGRSPAVHTLEALAGTLGWRVRVVDVDLDLSAVGPRSMVVVATQGHYDEPAVEAALATPAGYVGLVASQKRASTVRTFLRQQGVPEEELTRLRAPAGLDLGATSHEEIAVAVLAELVALRASRTATPPVEVTLPVTAVDPVCGMTVDVERARFVSEHDGSMVYFCAAGCQRSYDADPGAFGPAALGAPARPRRGES
jgi:xanthine dehydrogenase accessory factor